jgi:L-fucose isomerase-like protein
LAPFQAARNMGVQAITIGCLGGFDSGQLHSYPSLGFVELNNSGLVGAYEGDLASTVSMLALGYLFGRPGHISDPVIDLAQDRVIYAHCVAPTKVFKPRGADNP